MASSKTSSLHPTLMKPFYSEAELAEKSCVSTLPVPTMSTRYKPTQMLGKDSRVWAGDGCFEPSSPLPWRDPIWQQSRASALCHHRQIGVIALGESVLEAPAQYKPMWDDANNKSFWRVFRDVFQNQLLFMAVLFFLKSVIKVKIPSVSSVSWRTTPETQIQFWFYYCQSQLGILTARAIGIFHRHIPHY